MTQNIIKEENFIKTITEYFEIIPYLRNNKINNKYYELEESKSYKQAFFNNLVNLYNKKYYFSILNNVIDEKKLNVYSENETQNLLLNVREKKYETTFKYLFGYQPKGTESNKYYFFNKVSPNNVNESEEEHIYTDVEYYQDLIIPEELKKISKSISMYKSILLNIPLFLKHYEHIFKYSIKPENILNVLKSELTKINCPNYLSLLNDLEKVEPKSILHENKEEYFYMLTAMFLDKEFNNLELNKKTIGYMLYNIIKNKSLCSLNLELPESIEVSDLNFLKEKISNNMNKTIITSKKKPASLQEFFGKNYIAVTDNEKKLYNDSLNNGFINLFNGGYSNNTEENKKIVSKIKEIENIKDDKIILTQTILPVFKNIQKYSVQNIDELKELLFHNLVIDNAFFQSHEFKRDLHKIFELSNKSINIIKYDLDDFEFNVFSLSTIPDEKKFIQIYMYYFNIIKNICSYMVNNKNFYERNLDFTVYELGLMILKTLDIIGKISIDDVLAFRYYMEYYYNILNIINKKMPYISLVPYINSIIDLYKNNVVRRFVGGDPSINKIINFKNFYSFNYFDYSYLLDVITNLKEGNNNNFEFYKGKDNPEYLFWDGMSFEEFNQLSNNDKIIKSVVCYVMFINETVNGDKMCFKFDKKHKTKRVCFLPKLINDKTTVAKLLNKLTLKLDRDINYEKNIENFLIDLNVILKNTDISGLIKKLHKIDDPSVALGLTSYIKNKEEPSNNTFIELMVFICIFLKKLGFKVNKTYSKTNLKLEIEPQLSKENILKYLNEKGKQEFNEKYNELISENSDLIEFLISNSVNKNIYDIGGDETESSNSVPDKSIITLALNEVLDFNTNISKNLLNNFENNTDIFNNEVIEEEELFIKEKENLNEEIGYLLNVDELTENNLYRIIPNYIKSQYKIFRDNTFLDEIFSNNKSIGGANHPIDEFLKKISTESCNNVCNLNLSEEKIKQTINLILNERFLQNLNNNSLLYYDNVLFNNDRNVYKTALYSTIKNFEYLKNIYKINVSDNIKESLLELITNYTQIEQYIYQIFIVSEYIKKFVNYMYQKLGISHNSYELNYEKFLNFYQILECKFKEKSKVNEKIYDFIKKNNLTKLHMDKSKYEFKEVNKESLLELFKNNSTTQTKKNMNLIDI